MTAVPPTTIDEERLGAFASRIATDQNAGVVAVLAYVADRIGLWASLAASGSGTASDLAERTGLDPVYLTGWLAAMAAAGYVNYESRNEEYHLPAEHAMVLADDESPFALAGGFEFQAGCWADADRIADLFVSGGGVPWGDRDERLTEGAARFFRPLYREALVAQWLPALSDVVPKLQEGAHVLDVGCGQGFATSLVAAAFPQSTVLGIDIDEGSIAIARESARATGLENLRFQVAEAAGDLGGGWDLICVFDAFHHIGAPVDAARRMRRALAHGGTLMLVEPLARDSVEDNLAAAGPLYYAPSTLVCLPDAIAQGNGFALGAQAGPKRLTRVLTDAGFTSVRIAAETEFNLVIEARP